MEYQYTPLRESNDEIRLLHLLPGQHEDALRVLIEHVDFSEDQIPDYEALSYTLGDQNDYVEIEIGQRGGSFLTVTRNLADALPCLRRGDSPRVIWVDAICVNQKDLGERSRQVALMASLYTRAKQVLVWLDLESDNSSEAFDCAQLIREKVRFSWIVDQPPVFLTDEAQWTKKEGDVPFSWEQLKALVEIYDRPWFSRLWVWQEVRLGGDRIMVYCGQRCLPCGEALFGPLPAHIRVLDKSYPDESHHAWVYRDRASGKLIDEDPRLGLLPSGWKRSSELCHGFWPFLEHEDTGESRNFLEDPRCDIENLIARGVAFETLELV